MLQYQTTKAVALSGKCSCQVKADLGAVRWQWRKVLQNFHGIYKTQQEFAGQEFRRNSCESESFYGKGHAVDAMGSCIDNRVANTVATGDMENVAIDLIVVAKSRNGATVPNLLGGTDKPLIVIGQYDRSTVTQAIHAFGMALDRTVADKFRSADMLHIGMDISTGGPHRGTFITYSPL